MDAAQEIDLLMAGLAPVIKSFVDHATLPLLERIAALEAREPEELSASPPALPLDAWQHDIDVLLAAGRTALAEQKAAAAEMLSCLPAPLELHKSIDSVALESRAIIGDLKGQVADLTAHLRERADADSARVTAALAIVKDGRDGVDGKSIDPADVRGFVVDEVKQAIAAIPAPNDGHTPTED